MKQSTSSSTELLFTTKEGHKTMKLMKSRTHSMRSQKMFSVKESANSTRLKRLSRILMATPHWFTEFLQAAWSEMMTICKTWASSAWLDQTLKFVKWKCIWQKATMRTWRVILSQNHTRWQTTGKDFSAPWKNRSFHTTSMTSSSGRLKWRLRTEISFKS